MGVRSRFAQRLVTLPDDVSSVVRSGPEEPATFDVERVWREMVGFYRTGLHPAIALCVRHQGRVVLDRTIGHVDNPPGAASPGPVATPDTLFSLFSASKILTAMVIHSIAEEGLLDLDAPAATYLPELARHRKERIRLTHLLNHTAGIADMPQGLDVDRFLDEGRLSIELLADLAPSHPPGLRVAYHPMTSWLILSEIVQRVTGQDLRQHLQERFLDPLGMKNLSYGVGPADISRVARHATTGPVAPRMMDRIFTRTIGVSCSLVEQTNEDRFLTGLFPSANIIGTANETCRFMQMLLDGGELDGVRVLRADTVRRAVTEVTG
ncbi:MAG: serine hydrolase domain-containing protein, partial [Myxococcota bacterium]|nr:serine hydrolase domain-containing protein [Myxococcota bacterium]